MRGNLYIYVLMAVLAVTGPGIAVAQEPEPEGAAALLLAKPEFAYIEMRPLVLPVITPRGLTQQVSLVISLEIPYDDKAHVEYLLPKLTDAYIGELYGQLGIGGGLMTPQGALDPTEIKTRLTSTTEKVMGAEKVHDVMLQVVQQSGRR
ncbi:MAG: hypothetical protein ACAH80_17080 [Alphaproteobacteria bacterium]